MKIISNANGNFKMGRTRPVIVHHDKLTMKHMMANDLLPNVTPPTETHYCNKAATPLHQIYGNDVLGDCVIAGGFHIRGITSANSGTAKVFSQDNVIADYSAIGGYNPNAPLDANGNNPTDNGCDENTAIKFWQETGYPDGVKILGAVAVDPTNLEEIRLALYLFENLMFGVELPDKWVNPMPEKPGFVWDMAGQPDEDNGHCFIGCDLYTDGVKIDSWAMTGRITFPAVAYYAHEKQNGQLFTLLLPDVISRLTEKSPAGYDIATLQKFLSEI